MTANARYSTVDLSFDSDELSYGFNPDEINLNGTHQNGNVGITTSYNTRLFDKHFVGLLMLNSEWGQGGFCRVSGIALGMFMLRADRRTQFGLGALVLLNTNSRIPAFPVFMYRHSFNDKWRINLYGGIFGVDYTPTHNDLFALGADVDVKSFCFRPKDERLPKKARFSSASVRPMLKYRRRLLPNLYLDLQGGVALKMSCRVTGATGTHKYLDCNRKPSPFIQAGVSYAL